MKNKKGFSLVELLAVITILGILSVISIASYTKYVEMVRKEKEENNKNIAVMATKSYLQANREYLPQAVGELVEIKVTELKNNNYITEDLVDRKGVSCNEKSYVRVSKESENKYIYDPHIICGRDEESEDEIIPVIDITFEGDRLETKTFKATLKGSSDGIVKIASYSYRIYVNKIDTTNGKYEEVYNSESITVGNKATINLGPISLSKYFDVTRTNNIKVTITIINKKGKTLTKSEISSIRDEEGPVCGNVSYTPTLSKKAWLNKADIANGERRKVTVECEDNKESICSKKKVTKSWPEQENGKYISANKGFIQIKDNSGRTRDCEVDPQVDNEGPTIKIKAVKNSKSGNEFVPTTTIVYSEHTVSDGATLTINANDYNNGTTKWFNKNYPNGVGYSITVSDKIKLSKIEWKVNNTGLPAGTSNDIVKEIREGGGTTIEYGSENSDKNNTMSRYLALSGEGMRYARLTAYDEAGNKTTVYIYANIDRTAPNVPTVNGYKKTSTADATSTYKTLSDYLFESNGNGEWYNKYVYTKASGSSDLISGFEGYYCTSIGQAEDITDSKQSGRNVNIEGVVTIKYKACDNAGNCSNYKEVKTRLDRTKPNKPTLDMTHTYDKNKANGSRATLYSNNSWINKNVYMTDARTILSNNKFKGPQASDVVPKTGVTVSGILKYQISNNNSQWVDYNYDSSKELYKITNEGTSHRYIRSVDKAGNISDSTSFTIKIDKTKPTCSSYKFNTYSTYGVSVNVSCNDDRSGCTGKDIGNHNHVYKSTKWTVYDKAGISCSTSQVVNTRSQCDWVQEYSYSSNLGKICDSAGDIATIPGHVCGIYNGLYEWAGVTHYENCTHGHDNSLNADYRCCCELWKDYYKNVCHEYTEYY